MIAVRTETGTKIVQSIFARTASGLKEIEAGFIRTADGLKQFFAATSPISLSASPAFVSGASAGFSSVATNSTTVGVTGGAAPYSYAWTLQTSDGGTWTATAPSAATSNFICTGITSGDTFNATFRCTVTDALGNTGTIDVPATAINYGGIYL